LPDIAGLAWRMPPKLQPGNPWDALLASAGEGRVGRVVLRPVTSWAGATFSSLMPLRFEGDVWWLRARLTTFIENPGLSIDTVSQQIRRTGVKFHIEQACGTAEFAPLARLILNEVITDGRDVAFDPTLYSAPGVQLVPGWLTGLRRSAYRRSRQGRDVE